MLGSGKAIEALALPQDPIASIRPHHTRCSAQARLRVQRYEPPRFGFRR